MVLEIGGGVAGTGVSAGVCVCACRVFSKKERAVRARVFCSLAGQRAGTLGGRERKEGRKASLAAGFYKERRRLSSVAVRAVKRCGGSRLRAERRGGGSTAEREEAVHSRERESLECGTGVQKSRLTHGRERETHTHTLPSKT